MLRTPGLIVASFVLLSGCIVLPGPSAETDTTGSSTSRCPAPAPSANGGPTGNEGAVDRDGGQEALWTTTSTPTEPSRSTATPGPGPHPVDVRRERYHLVADDLCIITPNGLLFALDEVALAEGRLGGDPGNATYHSIESHWEQHGQEMRLYIYLRSDGTSWWSEEMRIYDGENEEWRIAEGRFLETPVGETYRAEHMEMAFTPYATPDAPAGILRVHEIRLSAFLSPHDFRPSA